MESVIRPGALLAVALGLLAGCGASPPAEPTPVPTGLMVETSAFGDGETIPPAFTCKGAGYRPTVSWTRSTAKAFALVVDDPDAPEGDFYHWIVLDLPTGTTSVGATVPASAHQAKNSSGAVGWTPPCPPSGTHHYRFTVYALSAPTGLAAGASPQQAVDAIQAKATEQGVLTALASH
ncbi:YbhB/YbcL family Raf kinase inhibitor-like protein [Cryptosporangium sp. NPDC051539]|uniref:YbhB/YbcL family Raf kinase inhibitor-like protein n=1 Tax=Cryptosporangium sp. NPDC051539 TaxID=3363962 RepID=UPI003797B3ED